MTRFEKLEGYPDEIQGRFNSFITTQFDDSLSVEMQIRSLIKWISSSRELINDIVDYLNLFIEMFDERLQEEIVGRLNEWLDDGTLAQIINNDVFDMKADKTFVDSEIERLDQKDEDLTTHVDSEIERLDQIDEDLTTHVDSEIERLDQIDEDLTTHVNSLEQNKRNKGESILFSADFKKQSNETDDQFINRLLSSLPDGQGTVVLDGKEYVLHNPIQLYKHQHLKGGGHGTVLNGALISDNIIERIEDPSESHNYGGSIERLTIRGNHNNTGIHLGKSTHYQIRDVYVYNTQWGIWADSSWLATFERITIRNNHVKQGELGFHIGSGTSNVLTNVWVKNFDKGYNTASIYTTFNSCACDSFVDYAYYNRQSTTLNGCGAEDGNLKEGSFVFGSLNRGVVYNACETLGIYYDGIKNGASFFKVVGGKVVNNSFRVGGTIVSSNMAIYSLESDAYVQDFNTVINSNDYTKHYFVPNKASASVVMEWYGALFAFHRWNGSNVLNGG